MERHEVARNRARELAARGGRRSSRRFRVGLPSACSSASSRSCATHATAGRSSLSLWGIPEERSTRTSIDLKYPFAGGGPDIVSPTSWSKSSTASPSSTGPVPEPGTGRLARVRGDDGRRDRDARRSALRDGPSNRRTGGRRWCRGPEQAPRAAGLRRHDLRQAPGRQEALRGRWTSKARRSPKRGPETWVLATARPIDWPVRCPDRWQS